MPVGRKRAADGDHRRRIVVRKYVGADARLAQTHDLPQFGDRNPDQKRGVGRRDFGIGHFGPPVQPAHFVAGFVERDVAPLQPADHLGGIVGIDKVGDTGHPQLAERCGAALDVEVHEDAAEVEYYVFDLFHKLLRFLFLRGRPPLPLWQVAPVLPAACSCLIGRMLLSAGRSFLTGRHVFISGVFRRFLLFTPPAVTAVVLPAVASAIPPAV